jgi:hypothetical protein
MDTERQQSFLIDMLKVMIRDLIVYRTFCEKEKQDASPSRHQQIEKFLNRVRRDPGVKSQLGPDFEIFVRDVLQGEERDAGLALDAFLRGWTPRRAPN